MWRAGGSGEMGVEVEVEGLKLRKTASKWTRKGRRPSKNFRRKRSNPKGQPKPDAHRSIFDYYCGDDTTTTMMTKSGLKTAKERRWIRWWLHSQKRFIIWFFEIFLETYFDLELMVIYEKYPKNCLGSNL